MARADRPSSEGEPDVDFVVGAPDDHADEELLPPPNPDRARTRRLRAELGVGALGLLAALLIARALFAHDHTSQAERRDASPRPSASTPSTSTSTASTSTASTSTALPSSSTGVSSTAPARPHPPFPKDVPQRHGTDPQNCPGLRCSRTSPAIPDSVSAAIQAAFPESMIERSQTVRLRGSGRVLWFREVDVRVGTQQLTLRVEAPTSHDESSSGHRTSHGQRTTFLETSLGPWHVDVDVLDLLGGQAPAANLRELAHDPRIVAG